MFRNQLQLGFPRQVVSCYLLFCMIAVSWLSVGLVFAVHTVLQSRAESECLSLARRAAAELEQHYLRNQPGTLEDLLREYRNDHQLAYCAVSSADGKFLAHTEPQEVGHVVPHRVGEQRRWNDVEATQFVTDEDQTIIEMQVPLNVRGKPIDKLYLATTAPDFWATALDTADAAPVAILAPLAVVAAGAWMLRRIALPIAAVHQQLQQIGQRPASSNLRCQKLPPNHALHVGWNRLVEALERSRQDASPQSLTDRVAAALQNRKQEESLHVLDSLADGIAVTDMEGRITFANRAIAALLGEFGHDDQTQGCPIYDYLANHVDNPESLEEMLKAGTGRPARTEVKRSHGDRQRILRVARQPLDGGEGGQVWSIRDVTQQKLAEEMRSQFIDSATHELRTPLANIKAYSETLALMDDVDLEQQKEFCNTINNEATRLARFVDDLLSVSSMEVGSLSINRQNVDLMRLFDEVVGKVRPLTASKSQEFEVDLPPKMGEALLDKDKISAMLVNLLGNASKYTPNEGTIALRVKTTDEGLRISVEDSGVGIAPDELPHIFEKFFRSKDPRVQGETGTGLGLSLANEVVRLHGGQLHVESELEKGSKFVVSIPVEQEARL